MGILVGILRVFLMLVMSVYFLSRMIPKRERYVRTDHVRLSHLKRLKAVSLSKPLSERARPRKLSEIIGQKDALSQLKAALFGPYPKHVILYGPPGVGKTTAARLIFREAVQSPGSPFLKDAPFVEMDASLIRYDERGIADPLIGSVHDPIYQGAGEKGLCGIPQPKEGAVTRAHGGVLFLDEIGEMHPMELNRLLKVMEDRVVRLESAYYEKGMHDVDEYTKFVFENGLPADFRLIAATTKPPGSLPSALRSRAVEICFDDLSNAEKAEIAKSAGRRIGLCLTDILCARIGKNALNGRMCVNIVELSLGAAAADGRKTVQNSDVEWAIRMFGHENAGKQQKNFISR